MSQGSIVDRAIQRAAQAHAGQRRKGSQAPYVVHPLEVLKRMADLGVTDADVLAAAALHDVVEDTPVTMADVRAEFGERIAGLVDEMTHDETQEDKLEYLVRFADRSPLALAIKLIDRATNVDDYARSRPEYAPRYAAKALVIYQAVQDRQTELGEALGREVAHGLVAEATRLHAFANG